GYVLPPNEEMFGWDGEDPDDDISRPYFVRAEKRSRIGAVLSPGDTPYQERFAALTKVVASIAGPTHPVGPWRWDDRWANHIATPAGWLVGYGEAEGGGPELTLVVPTEHVATARQAVDAIAAATGAEVVSCGAK